MIHTVANLSSGEADALLRSIWSVPGAPPESPIAWVSIGCPEKRLPLPALEAGVDRNLVLLFGDVATACEQAMQPAQAELLVRYVLELHESAHEYVLLAHCCEGGGRSGTIAKWTQRATGARWSYGEVRAEPNALLERELRAAWRRRLFALELDL